MAKNESHSLAWFLAGVTVGIAGAILYAPQSGEETRETIGRVTREGRDRLDQTRREVVERGRDVYEQGRRFAEEAAESGRKAVKRGKKTVSNLGSKGEEAVDDIEERLGI